MTMRMVAMAVAVLVAAPAAGQRTIAYYGDVDLRSASSTGQTYPGSLDGRFAYVARFYYDNAFALRGATLAVDGQTRENFVCPVAYGFCAALVHTPMSLISSVGTTPERALDIAVASADSFGGMNLFGPRSVSYTLQPDDASQAFITFSLFDNRTGFAYDAGDGDVVRVQSSVPEPTLWGLFVAGFGAVGLGLRRGRSGAIGVTR